MFGEDGVELLRESLEAKGLVDALGSLSDDEGVSDEGVSDGEEEEEEEGEGGQDSEGEADQSREEKLSEESPIPKTDDRASQQETVSEPIHEYG